MATRVEEYLAKVAVKEALHLPIGTEFVVSELYSLAEWNLISYEAREFARAGGKFWDELKEQKLLNTYIKEIGRRGSATLYQRVGKTVVEALQSDNRQ